MKNLTDYNDFVESKKILESKKEEEKEKKDKKSEKDEEKDEKKEEKDEKSDDSSKSDEDKYLTAGQKKLPAGLKASLIKKAKKTGKVAESLEEEIEAVMESAQLFDNT